MVDAMLRPNFRSPAALMQEAQQVCRRLFEHSPLSLLVLSPGLKIIDANEAHLLAIGRGRDALAGLDLFAAFPDSPHDPAASGVRNLSASLVSVLERGRADIMSLQRYDVKPDGRAWEVRHWHPKNWPVFDDKGSIIALVHHVVDATDEAFAREAPAYPRVSAIDLLSRADAAIRASHEITRQSHLHLDRLHRQIRG